jgi:hypothetical protein
MFSAARFVLAGAIVALFGGFLLTGVMTTPRADDAAPGAVTASPSPTTTDELLAGLVTEEVEPGVLRIKSDGAGHDLDERHPDFRYDMDAIAITGDGTIWLASTYHGSDNVANPPGSLVWALGRPGIYSVAEGIPLRGTGYLVPLADASVLVVSHDRVVRFDGTAFVPDDGPTGRPVHGGTLWLMEPDELMGLVADGASVERPDDLLAAIWNESWGRWDKGTQINRIAEAPDGSLWAVGGYEGEGGGLYRISLE